MTTVTIVGAGILGAAVADQLSHAGVAVTVIDSRQPGTATSGSSLAWINANQKLPRDYHDLSVQAMYTWRRLADDLGNPSWCQPTGGLTWATSDDERAALSERLERLRQWAYPADDVTARQASLLEPALQIPDGAQIAFFSSEGFVHGAQAVAALLVRAEHAGARIVVTERDASLEAQDGAITAVRLADGTRIHSDVYVCCAGWRTNQLLEPCGVTVPLVPADAPGSAAGCLVARTTGRTPVSRVVHAEGLAMRPAPGGGLHLEAGVINEAVDAHTPQDDLDRYGAELLRRAGRLLPNQVPQAVTSRLCVRPLPEDGHPIIGWLSELQNAYLMVTHSGITLAPLLAQYAATDIRYRTSTERLAPYRPTRFPRRDAP